MNRIRFTANALFIPFFLLSVGMLMDIRVLISSADALLTILLISITAIGSKWLASWVTSKVYGYSKTENMVIFGLSTTHAAATLAITLVGYQIGLFDQQIINAVIVIILVTCILGPYLCEKYGRKLARCTRYNGIRRYTSRTYFNPDCKSKYNGISTRFRIFDKKGKKVR